MDTKSAVRVGSAKTLSWASVDFNTVATFTHAAEGISFVNGQ